MNLWVVGMVLWDAGLVPKQCKEGSMVVGLVLRDGPMGCRVGPNGLSEWSQRMGLWVIELIPRDGPMGCRVGVEGCRVDPWVVGDGPGGMWV